MKENKEGDCRENVVKVSYEFTVPLQEIQTVKGDKTKLAFIQDLYNVSYEEITDDMIIEYIILEYQQFDVIRRSHRETRGS